MDASEPAKAYHAQFEQINPSARLVQVGITPGPTQEVNANNGTRRSSQRYFDFYNARGLHSALNGKTPNQAYFSLLSQVDAA